MIVRPEIAVMAAELNKAWGELLDKHLPGLESFAPFGLEMTTIDGLTARFYEEGIEFYPSDEKENN